MIKRTFSVVCSCTALAIFSPHIPAAAQSTTAATAADPYTRAVQEYISAAEKEVAQMRKEIADKEKAQKDADFSELKASLKDCERKIEQLKGSGPSRFDGIKKEYEAARLVLVELLNEMREGV